ncbi:MAG: cupredoxin domain-containing protein [Planctomycetota bacterium]
MKRKLTYSIMALVLIIVALSGQVCQPPQGGNGGDSGMTTVRMQNIAFNPKTITIQVGQTVQWINNDLLPHTVTSGNPEDQDAGSMFDSALLFLNGTFQHTFNETGTFVYYCRVHPVQMRDNTVIVQALNTQ